MQSILPLYKLLGISLFIFFSTLAYCQKEEIESYIPKENSSLITHPVITIKLKLYLVYRYENDKQNYTLDSLSLIKDQFNWINGYYKHLSTSTLDAKDGLEHYIPDSRIQFRLDTIKTIVDSVSWDRIFIAKDDNAVRIDSFNNEKKEVYIKSQDFFRVRNTDSISISGYNYSIISKQKNKEFVTVLLNKPLIKEGNLFYSYKKKDLNCDRYLWEKHTGSDSNYLHLFFTGSSLSNIAFGCGPSPYFLNVSNMIKGGGWANAQLIAHEIGHTLGLSHTNYPQFDDLPPNDKFGFIPCDSTKTSNNIMGYNQCRNYLSPKQVGYVHQLYSTKLERIKLTTANEYNLENTIVIWNDTTWNKATLITGDIVVKKRQVLTLNKNVHLSEGSTIYLEKKAKLILNNAELNNHFDSKWRGIVYCKSIYNSSKDVKKKKNRATIKLNNNSSIKNNIH